ncbi:MAG: c-type cytochrome [Verrucomicrobia bacterium]|nr:c-type cytochrome [Verrucomicrobiota bacterium]
MTSLPARIPGLDGVSPHQLRLRPRRAVNHWVSIPTAVIALAWMSFVGPVAQDAVTNAPAKRPFYLPKSPVAAAYVLGRLSNQELIEAPRGEFVYVALLQRQGLDRKYRMEALEGLAKLRQSDQLTESIGTLVELDKKGEQSEAVLRELAAILLQHKSEDLAAKAEILAKISADSQLPLTRQIGYAAQVTAAGSFEGVWRQAEAGGQHLVDLLLAVPLIRDGKLRATLYSKAEPLLDQSDRPALRRAAMAAAAAMPGYEMQAFRKLSALAQTGVELPAAIAALQRIAKKLWPGDTIEPLAESLIRLLEKVPAENRTQPDVINAIQFATDLTSLLPMEKSQVLTKLLAGLGVRVFVIRTLHEQMLYDKQRIVTEAGKPLEIVFENDDVMPHNLVVVTPGSVEEIGLSTETMAAEPDAQGRLYVPVSSKVLHATKLLQPGEKAKLSFTAPEEPGDYPYVCTFPGHWRRMVGLLVVVRDVEAYLASHPEPAAPQATEWKISELAPDLHQAATARNLHAGKQLFTSLACAQCHRLGAAGFAFGPDLTDVFQRWKGDRLAVLSEIIEPSKVINDRYRNHEFELKNGESVFGLIVKEDADTVTIQAGASDVLIQTVQKSDIQSRKPQASSLMPVGLLSQISRGQILDLLAFLESGGKLDAEEHKH